LPPWQVGRELPLIANSRPVKKMLFTPVRRAAFIRDLAAKTIEPGAPWWGVKKLNLPIIGNINSITKQTKTLIISQ
jgi:hypothetical protein